MNAQTEFKEKLSQEEIDELASVLMEEIKEFYNSERGKHFWEEYISNNNMQFSALKR